MKYTKPEMIINKFECEAVEVTQVSSVPTEGYVAGLQEINAKRKISLENFTQVTKFVF